MTAFDFAVLFGPTRFDVPQADTGFLHGQRKGKGEFRPIVDPVSYTHLTLPTSDLV